MGTPSLFSRVKKGPGVPILHGKMGTPHGNQGPHSTTSWRHGTAEFTFEPEFLVCNYWSLNVSSSSVQFQKPENFMLCLSKLRYMANRLGQHDTH